MNGSAIRGGDDGVDGVPATVEIVRTDDGVGHVGTFVAPVDVGRGGTLILRPVFRSDGLSTLTASVVKG